jgi:hypothetical protein
LDLYSVNGELIVTPSSDGSVHVQGQKDVHSGGDPRTVHYAVVRDGTKLVICALWGDNGTCDADGMHGNSRGNDDGDRRRNVSVKLAVQVPANIRTSGSTVNGEVSVERLSSDVRARTVNGSVRVSQVTGEVSAKTVNGDVTVDTRGGPVSAETVNGAVHATFANQGSADMRFRSVNGEIDIDAPPTLNADVELSTLNGSIESSYQLEYDRGHRRASGTVGKGGPNLRASTVSGSISLH